MDSSINKLDSHQRQHQTQHNQLQSPQSKPQSRSLPTTNSTTTKWLPHEERLRKAWRMIGTNVAYCMSKAEKATAAGSAVNTSGNENGAKIRELDESVVLFLRHRREFHRLLSHTEAKLQGKAEEMESLETYVRTQPRIGTRKRKR
jgi:hypothetical protein